MRINNKLIYSIPLSTIGIVMIILGLRWVFVSEPWMLDEVANIDRLKMSFNDLFSQSPQTLPDYLRQIYRFFGLWVCIIGLFITLFSMPKVSSNP